MARRTNYGFQKKQRELRKQKKKQEKADRRGGEETSSPAPTSGEGVDKSRLELDSPDHG